MRFAITTIGIVLAGLIAVGLFLTGIDRLAGFMERKARLEDRAGSERRLVVISRAAAEQYAREAAYFRELHEKGEAPPGPDRILGPGHTWLDYSRRSQSLAIASRAESARHAANSQRYARAVYWPW